MALYVLLSQCANAAEVLSLSTTTAGKINLTADNVPLAELVRDLSQRFGLVVKAPLFAGERVHLELNDSTLDETLRWLLRGYDYVLMTEDSVGGSLLILTRTEKSVDARMSIDMPLMDKGDTKASSSILIRSLGRSRVSSENRASDRSLQTSSVSQTMTQQTQVISALSLYSQAQGATGATAGNVTVVSLAPPIPPHLSGLEMPPAARPVAFQVTPATSSVPEGADTASQPGLPSVWQPQPQSDSPVPPQIPINQVTPQPNANGLTPPQIPMDGLRR